MKSTGIVRKVDELGRVVLPIELRRNMGIEIKDSLEIFVDENTIILQKYEPADIFTGSMDDLIDYKKLKVYKTHQDLILMPGRSRKSRKRTVLPMRISEKTGIQAETFDAVINEMNDIQDYILYKEE